MLGTHFVEPPFQYVFGTIKEKAALIVVNSKPARNNSSKFRAEFHSQIVTDRISGCYERQNFRRLGRMAGRQIRRNERRAVEKGIRSQVRIIEVPGKKGGVDKCVVRVVQAEKKREHPRDFDRSQKS
jgi:hypothetical protein